MNFKILKTDDPNLMEQMVESYQSTGWLIWDNLQIFQEDNGKYRFFLCMGRDRA